MLRQADRLLTLGWWCVLLLRGLLPALFAIAVGALVGAVQRGDPLAAPLVVAGVVFVLHAPGDAKGVSSYQPGAAPQEQVP